MDFTPKNVDKLYSQRPDSKNIWFKPNGRNFQHVSLYIKDYQNNNGQVKEVFWSSIEHSLKIFKEKDFDHLWNKEYLPKAIREQMAMERYGVVDPDKQQQSANNVRAGPNISNTNAYK